MFLKLAYKLGFKLAMEQAGISYPQSELREEEGASNNAANNLLTVLRNIPDPNTSNTTNRDRAVGEPEDDGRTYSGAPSGNFTNDLLNTTSLDVRGPEITSI